MGAIVIDVGVFEVRRASAASDDEAQREAQADDLSLSAREILVAKCRQCHGGAEPEAELDVLDHAALIGAYLVPGDPSASDLWTQIESDEMPPGDPLSREEKETVKSWISRGAKPFPEVIARQTVSLTDILTTIQKDLAVASPQQRRSFRYVSIHPVYNNSFARRVGRGSINATDSDVEQTRFAFSKLINSLSWSREIAPPRMLDETGVVMRIDLQDYGWDNAKWQRVLRSYPYARDLGKHSDEQVAKVADEIWKLRQDVHPRDRSVPFVRGDWFVAEASRNELYYDLISPPSHPGAMDSIKSLETFLGVDCERSFSEGKLARASFRKSNVSNHNRSVERYPTRFGGYWKSYDFESSIGARDLIRNPLGPDFEGNPFSNVAFEFDGGEMIFSLPNGLQGYYLADGLGARLPGDAPVSIVQDKTKASGGPSVVNAVSCMSCHKEGMIRFQDEVRQAQSLSGSARKHVEQIYVTQPEMDALLRKDRDRFLAAIDAAYQGLGRTNPGPRGQADSLLEPVRQVALRYQQDLQIEEITIETSVKDVTTLMALIDAMPSLRRLGLRPLLTGGGLKRSQWEEELFDELIVELELGTPIH